MTADKPLVMWAVYERPKDYPDVFVARAWLITGAPEPVATGSLIISATLAGVRGQLARDGLVCLARNSEDDPAIVETWL
jgi:hypothetical protein